MARVVGSAVTSNYSRSVVISSVIGGAAGKLIARYAFRWKKAQRLVESLWDIGGKLKTLVGDFIKSRKALGVAESCAKKNSFVAGTLVVLADGSKKPIERLKLGDEVLATDPVSGKTVGKKIVATITSTESKNFVQVTVDIDGKKGDAVGTVTATELHPFWIPKTAQWVEAGDLAVGQGVYLRGGAEGEITSIRRWSAVAPVFNLTVDDIHTYYVLAGNTPVLVHNCDVPAPSLAAEPLGPMTAREATDSLAGQVGDALGVPVKAAKGDGFTLSIPSKPRNLSLRVMNAGSGGRDTPYWRLSVEGKQAFTRAGKPSTDPALIHIDVDGDSFETIMGIVNGVRR